MKDPILQFTTKPKWPCYFDLHTLPPQGDKGHHSSWQSWSSSCPRTCPLTQTFSTPSFRLECCSLSGRHWLQPTTWTPGPWPPLPTGACDRQHCPLRRGCAHQRPVWSPYNGGLNSRRDQCRQSPSNHHPDRVQTPHHNSQDNENGICWYHNKILHKSYICVSPCRWQGNGVTSLWRKCRNLPN